MAVRLFVGNLPYTVTEADLKEHFSAVGQVSGVWLPTDRETGRPRGFGFVEFDDRALAEEAIRRFHNQPLGGRLIAVNEARPQERGSGPPPPRAPFNDGPRPGGPPRAPFGDAPRPPGPPRERSDADGGFEPRRPAARPEGARPAGGPGFADAGEERAPRVRKPKKPARGRDFDRVRGPKRPIRQKAGGRFYSGEGDDDLDLDSIENLDDVEDDLEELEDDADDDFASSLDDEDEAADEPEGEPSADAERDEGDKG